MSVHSLCASDDQTTMAPYSSTCQKFALFLLLLSQMAHPKKISRVHLSFKIQKRKKKTENLSFHPGFFVRLNFIQVKVSVHIPVYNKTLTSRSITRLTCFLFQKIPFVRENGCISTDRATGYRKSGFHGAAQSFVAKHSAVTLSI